MPPWRPWAAIAVVFVLLIAVTPQSQAAQSEPDGAAPLRGAWEALLDVYVEPLSPPALLEEAYTGMAASLTSKGIDAPPLPPLPESRRAAWSSFVPVLEQMVKNSGGEMSGRELAYVGIRAMTAARNECHTYFMPPEAMRSFQNSLDGRQEFVGIGVRATTTPVYTIRSVIPGSPAERAGVQAGDIVLAVNETVIEGLTASEISRLIRGPRDTSVTLRIDRAGTIVELVVGRAPVQIPTVIAKMLTGNVGYIELTVFTNSHESARKIREAMDDLETQGARSWVLDLRNNGGGGVESMREVLGVFLSPTEAMTVVRRTGREQTLTTTGQPRDTWRPLAVLIGGGSASAAEISAAALRDAGRARLFGEKTAGCANMGEIRHLSDGAGMLVTTARVLAGPGRRPLDGTGATPDETVAAYSAADPALTAARAYAERAALPFAHIPTGAGLLVQ